MCEADLWALGSSLSSEDAPEWMSWWSLSSALLLPHAVLLMESALQCLPRVWLTCASACQSNGFRFPKRFIQR